MSPTLNSITKKYTPILPSVNIKEVHTASNCLMNLHEFPFSYLKNLHKQKLIQNDDDGGARQHGKKKGRRCLSQEQTWDSLETIS